MQKTHSGFGITGAGWLGLPLASFWAGQGHKVTATTTTPAKIALLKKAGIEPLQLAWQPEPAGQDPKPLFEHPTIVINIPPGTRTKGPIFHGKQMQAIIPYLKAPHIQQVVYISATSEYADTNQTATENSPLGTNDRAQALLRAEGFLQDAIGPKLVILRLGGLLGHDRIPGRYSAGKNLPGNGLEPVNYVHQDDAVRAIDAVVQKKVTDRIFNLVAPEHPTKKEVYQHNAAKIGFNPPVFTGQAPTPYKEVVPNRFMQELNFQFKFANPLHFSYTP